MNQDLKRTLWAAADKLRSSMDAAEYKHIVLGLIFLKYISDAFDERRLELAAAFADETSDLSLRDPEDRALATEERDYYTMSNVFWVPGLARWETIRANAKQADIGTRIDLAMDAIEVDNPRLKGRHANRRQAIALTELRDALLPRLVAGTLQLSVAQKQFEEALA